MNYTTKCGICETGKKVFSNFIWICHQPAVFNAPEVERSERSIWRTAFAERFKTAFGKSLPAVHLKNAVADSQVFETENVASSERENQQHLRRPGSDAAQGGEFGNDFFIGFFGKPVEIDRSGKRGVRDSAQIFDFASGEPAGAERVVVNPAQIFRRDSFEQSFETTEDGGRRADCKLLMYNALGQSMERAVDALRFGKSGFFPRFP